MQIDQLTDTLKLEFDEEDSQEFLIYIKTIITSKGFPVHSIDDIVKFQNKFNYNWKEMFYSFQKDRKWNISTYEKENTII